MRESIISKLIELEGDRAELTSMQLESLKTLSYKENRTGGEDERREYQIKTGEDERMAWCLSGRG